MANPIEKALRFGERREEKRAQNYLGAINLLEPVFEEMTDEELKAQTDEFKKRLTDGEELDSLIPETFAVAREASKRVLGKRPYDVQMLGGIALHLGQVAEMRTGEGKAVTVDTLIPTPEGAKPALEIIIGDTIYTGTGELTNVTGVFPQGRQNVYRVHFIDGRHIDCNNEHLWEVVVTKRVTETVTTKVISERLSRGETVFIPRAGKTHALFPVSKHPVSDLYSGDWFVYVGSSDKPLGCLSELLEGKEDPEGVAERAVEAFKALRRKGAIVAPHDSSDNATRHYQINIEEARPVLEEANLTLQELLTYTVDPHIPATADKPLGSEKQIRALIKNTVTTSLPEAHGYIASAWSELDAETIAWHARALGWEAVVRPADNEFGWAVDINRKPNPHVQVIAVEDMGYEEEQVCFAVSHPSHLFLAGDHVVTHNTLTAVAPMYLNALTGKGAHLVTTNDYLAREQEAQMGRVYSFLGMTHGAIQESMEPAERKDIYARDIVYGTNNQFGFDYLRDNIAKTPEERVQRELNFVIIDELDSILIDEAGTPLIISAPAKDVAEAEKWFEASAHLVENMVPGVHYEFDKKKRTAQFLEEGYNYIEDIWGTTDKALFGTHSELLTFLRASLQAKALYEYDKDYIVRGSEVMIVDEHTGRAMEGRRFSNGLHQALEAKERIRGKFEVAIQPENPTVATITLQNFFRLYDKMSGMTGTAESEAAELADTYELTVRVIPPNKPLARVDLPDAIYVSENAKFKAVITEIKELHDSADGTYITQDGEERPLVQPILIGTTSVAASEKLSRLLSEAGIRHNVLNARHEEQEAHIIAQAGRLGAVTVSTNMAGRGTDILLGGNADMIVEEQLAIMGLTPQYTPVEYENQRKLLQPIADAKAEEEAELVRELGGLYVIGTTRHDSRRIDNQLIGRAGRQGDPGRSKFFLSLDDEILRFYGASNLARVARAMSKDPDTPVTGKLLTKAIESAQASIDGRHREARKNTLQYDDVLTEQRKTTYSERAKILTGDTDFILDQASWFIEQSVSNTVGDWLDEQGKHADDWNLNKLWRHLKDELQWSPTISPEDLEEEYPSATELTRDAIVYELTSAAEQQWLRMVELDKAHAAMYARAAALSAIDDEWVAHLADLEYLKEGIGLRSYAQKDPKIEYKLESGAMYNQMNRVFVKRSFTRSILGTRH